MKMLMYFLALSAFMANAKADGVFCYRDLRPVDGNYSAILLESKEDGTYSLTSKVITAGFGGPVETSETVLATNLKCSVNGLLANCLKVNTSGGLNTLVKFKKVDTTELSSSRNGKIVTNSSLVVEFSGDAEDRNGDREFSLNGSMSNCKSL